MTTPEFGALQRWIRVQAGIEVGPSKRPLLTTRLSPRLHALQLATFGDYLDRVEADPDERLRMLDLVTTHETSFFREPAQFEYLEKKLFPRWFVEGERGDRPRSIRAYSAGSSTGEEPFSIAMMLLAHFAERGWALEVVGGDISSRAVERAMAATWPIGLADSIPSRYLKAFMLRGNGPHQGSMRASPELRAIVHLERLNLDAATDPVSGDFDLVFCRNVLIYFNAEARKRALGRLLSHLGPDGHLFLGHAESLQGHGAGVRGVIPNVYVLQCGVQEGIEAHGRRA